MDYAFIADSAIAVFNVYFNLLKIKTLVLQSSSYSILMGPTVVHRNSF